ncbi:hypothetical protein GC167_09705 [bacterium]|nr:hypothetical protein [bacterium]
MKLLSIVCTFWLMPAALWGQTLDLRPDTQAVAIGTESNLTAGMRAAQWRVSPDSSWILLDSTGTATDSTTRLRVMALDSGLLALTVYALSEAGETLGSGSTSIGVFLPPPRPEVELEDIHEPLDPGRNWLIIALVVLLIAMVGAFVLYAIRKKLLAAPKATLHEADRVVDPHQEALEALRQLREERSWEQLSPEAFYTRATDVYRAYLKRALGVDALERTNSELAGLLDLSAWNLLKRSALQTLAERADLAKYAEDRIRNNDPQDLDRIEQLLEWHEEDRNKMTVSEVESMDQER